MVALNAQGQPLDRRFNAHRNRDKALYSLLGICRGLVADQVVNPREVLFLHSWLKNCPELRDDPDGRDLACCIESILEDSRIDQDELDDLKQLIESILRYRQVDAGEADEINMLLGMLTGISADHHINEVETAFLHLWIQKNVGLRDSYPASIVLEAVEDILADGIVTEGEKQSLIKLLHSIVGNRFETTGIAYGLSTEFCCQAIDALVHSGRTFCFTGTLSLGPRAEAERLISNRGGRVIKSVTRDLNVLVVGAIASRDWRFSAHGRKIEKALKYQTAGLPLVIINERTWKQFL